LSMFYRIDLLVFNRLFVLKVVSIKFDSLGHLGMPLVDLSMNNLIGKAYLRFY
jgi:hypothetical protein